MSRWRDRLQLWRADPPHQIARRFAVLAARAGFARALELRALPQLLSLIAREGLGAHMIHALWAATAPDRLALVDDRRQLTWAEADAEIEALRAGLLARLGLEPGQSVLLMMENRVEYLLVWAALMRAGAGAVHASWRLEPDELIYQLEHSGAAVALVDRPRQPTLEAALEARPDLEITPVVLGPGPIPHGRMGYEELRAPLPGDRRDRGERREREERGSANVVYTSGTTGRPKGAVRDFTGFGVLELSRVLERLDLRVGDRHLLVAPMYHSAGQVFALLHAALGATVYVRPHFEAEDTLRALSTHDIHSVFMVPTMIRRVLELGAEAHARWPTPALRAVVSGAAPFPQALRERVMVRFGAEHLFDFYGATEIGWVTLIRGDEMRDHPGSVGRPIAGQQVAIFDEQGRRLDPGEVGQVYVRNEQIMRGYLGDDEASAQIRRGRWAGVEDLGRLDDDGYLYLEGRARDMVISGGVNLYPAEIEEALAHHPAVAEIAAFGVPDEEWGERLEAAVAPAPGHQLDPESLREWARGRLARHKIPRRFHILESCRATPPARS